LQVATEIAVGQIAEVQQICERQAFGMGEEGRENAEPRALGVGLRNYLFIGHPAAGWRSTVIYSVVGTCRLIGVNPQAYISWVLPKLGAATNRTVDNLLPHDFARLHGECLTQR
jgi:hypothetical protein